MKLHWTAEALADRAGIFDHIESDNLAAALALDELFSEKAMRLVDHPMLGHQGQVDGTRELVVLKSYILVYEIAEDVIHVLRLLHTAMQWPDSQAQSSTLE